MLLPYSTKKSANTGLFELFTKIGNKETSESYFNPLRSGLIQILAQTPPAEDSCDLMRTENCQRVFDGLKTNAEEEPHLVFALKHHDFKPSHVVFQAGEALCAAADLTTEQTAFETSLEASKDGVCWSVLVADLSRPSETPLGGPGGAQCTKKGRFWGCSATLRECSPQREGPEKGENCSTELAEVPLEKRQFFRFFRVVRRAFLSIEKTVLHIKTFELFGEYRNSSNCELRFLHFSEDFDRNGAVFLFGTKDGSRAWRNPARSQLLTVRSSGESNCDIRDVVGREATRCVTDAREESWVSVDFGPNVSVLPTFYTLRHYSCFDTEAVRNWLLQGSNDGKNWKTLSQHQNDKALARRGQSHTWSIPYQPGFFAMFRVLQIGLNSNLHYYLALSGFEIYGTMKIEKHHFDRLDIVSVPRRETKDSRTDGILYYLGTQGLRSPWANPVHRKFVEVDSSPLERGSAPFTAVCGREVARCVTAGCRNAWFALRFPKCQIKLTHYSLRHCASLKSEALRSWELQGSNDGVAWTVLRSHEGDSSLYRAGDTRTWPCRTGEFFSHFRVTQTGRNSNNHLYLVCSGIEFYGWIKFDDLQSFQGVRDDAEKSTSKSLEKSRTQPSQAFKAPATITIRKKGKPAQEIPGYLKKDLFQNNLCSYKQNWDVTRHSRFMQFDRERGSIGKISLDESWQIALSEKVFSTGKLECQVEILNKGSTTNVWGTIVGIVPQNVNYNKHHCIGFPEGWGYIGGNGSKMHDSNEELSFGAEFGSGDVIGIVVDFDKSTLSFYKNHLHQGVAFTEIPRGVRVAVCFTGVRSSARLTIFNEEKQ